MTRCRVCGKPALYEKTQDLCPRHIGLSWADELATLSGGKPLGARPADDYKGSSFVGTVGVLSVGRLLIQAAALLALLAITWSLV